MAVSSSRLEILLAGDHHADLLAAFIREVWDPAASEQSVRAAREREARHNVAQPGTAPPTWIAVQDGRALGYVTTIPIRLWDGSAEWPAYWIKGLMVLPEFRGGPVGYLVLKAAAAHLGLSGGLAVAEPARRLFQALGYRDLGPVTNWVRPLAPQRILARLNPIALGLDRKLPAWARSALPSLQRSRIAGALAWVGGAALRTTAQLARLPARGIRSGPLDPAAAGPELDALWRAARAGYRSAVVRDFAYLTWRYPAGPEGPYRWLGVRRDGKLAGVAIVRRPGDQGDERLEGIRLATVADFVCPPADRAAGLALLGAAEKVARQDAADGLLFMSSSPAIAPLLKRQWYWPVGGNVHLLFRSKEPGAAFPDRLEDWWLTRGDGQADEAF